MDDGACVADNAVDEDDGADLTTSCFASPTLLFGPLVRFIFILSPLSTDDT